MSKLVACVTGAGSGIGAAIAQVLCDRGFHVIVSDISLEAAQSVAGQLEAAEAMIRSTTS